MVGRRLGIEGTRVAIVGGSIAGCAAAVALDRVGCEVSVFERTEGDLAERGAGIAIPVSLKEQLMTEGYLDVGYPSCRASERLWLVADDHDRFGRALWSQPSPAIMNNWSDLWQGLRSRMGHVGYHDAMAVSSLRLLSGGAEISFDDGSCVAADLVIGADGSRSVVRGSGHGAFGAGFAGYVAWRLGIPEGAIADVGPLGAAAPDTWFTLCYRDGHAIVYWIPSSGSVSAPVGERRVLNFVIYSPAPSGLALERPAWIPPGEVPPAMRAQFEAFVDARFPAWWSTLIRQAAPDQLSLQPVYDGAATSYVDGPVVLVGDAGSLARPHTGSGATKALSDALALERACRRHDTWSDALDDYDAERGRAGRELVALGRRLGHDMVEATPEWSTMDAASLDAFTKATVAGHGLYFYGNASDQRRGP